MAKAVLTEYDYVIKQSIDHPVRIAQLSDLHSRRADDILSMLKKASPDLIVITGDTLERYDNRPQYDYYQDEKFHTIKWAIIHAIHYVNWFLILFAPQDKKSSTKNAYEILSQVSQIAPVYMSLGNHEQKLLYNDYTYIQRCGITLLDNAYQKVTVKGFSFLIGGMSSWDFEPFLEDFKKQKGFKLLLCHHPERFERLLKDTDIDLTLSGHTHGGQIRIGKKGRGFFVPGQSVFGKYAHGRFFDGRLIVSAGCSNTVAIPRFFNPRELVIVTIKGE
ncbi:MAG: metallophosphoesterase [Ruminococcus sp.]|nr:metallophosphoesterase [Eubacterium sp.]MBQ6153676.1 metallophosphoesterase [Ruminococcus sp.]